MGIKQDLRLLFNGRKHLKKTLYSLSIHNALLCVRLSYNILLKLIICDCNIGKNVSYCLYFSLEIKASLFITFCLMFYGSLCSLSNERRTMSFVMFYYYVWLWSFHNLFSIFYFWFCLLGHLLHHTPTKHTHTHAWVCLRYFAQQCIVISSLKDFKHASYD